MNVPEINEVKVRLDDLKQKGLITNWELPYENILTRRSAAIFFITPHDEASLQLISSDLSSFKDYNYRLNEEKKLSQLSYRITFVAQDNGRRN